MKSSKSIRIALQIAAVMAALFLVGCVSPKAAIVGFKALPAKQAEIPRERQIPVKVDVSSNYLSVAKLALNSRYAKNFKSYLPRTGILYFDAKAENTLEVTLYDHDYLKSLATGPLNDVAGILGATTDTIIDVKIRLSGPKLLPKEASYPVRVLTRHGVTTKPPPGEV